MTQLRTLEPDDLLPDPDALDLAQPVVPASESEAPVAADADAHADTPESAVAPSTDTDVPGPDASVADTQEEAP